MTKRHRGIGDPSMDVLYRPHIRRRKSLAGFPSTNLPAADSGELLRLQRHQFKKLSRDEACFISGGTKTRFLARTPGPPPPGEGKETTGANSIAVRDHEKENRNFSSSLAAILTADTVPPQLRPYHRRR